MRSGKYFKWLHIWCISITLNLIVGKSCLGSFFFEMLYPVFAVLSSEITIILCLLIGCHRGFLHIHLILLICLWRFSSTLVLSCLRLLTVGQLIIGSVSLFQRVTSSSLISSWTWLKNRYMLHSFDKNNNFMCFEFMTNLFFCLFKTTAEYIYSF